MMVAFDQNGVAVFTVVDEDGNVVVGNFDEDGDALFGLTEEPPPTQGVVTVSSTRHASYRTNSADQYQYNSNTGIFASAILYIVAVHNDVASGTAAAPTLTSIAPVTVAWTQLDTVLFNGDLNRQTVYWGIGDGTTGTIRASFSPAQTGCSLDVIWATGFDAADPTEQVVTGSGTGTAVSVATAAWSDATNNAGLLLVAVAAANGVSADTGWTEIGNDITRTPPAARNADFYRLGEDTSPTATIAASSPWAALFVEIAAGGSVPVASSTKNRSRRHGGRPAVRRASRW